MLSRLHNGKWNKSDVTQDHNVKWTQSDTHV